MLSRFVHILVASVLAASLIPIFAYADESTSGASVVEQLTETNEASIEDFATSGNVDALLRTDAYQGNGSNIAPSAVYPTSYDLRNESVVTKVKLQNPWGTCWSFGAIAASEISIMSEMGLTTDSAEIDLSELHLAWFSYTPLPADAGSQANEGIHTVDTSSSGVLNQGGLPFTATSIFSSGIGPINETDVPYKNKEDLVINDSQGNPYYYSPDADWSVDESLRFAQVLELEESSVLPSPATRNESGSYAYDDSGTQAIKGELVAGRGVEIVFCADTSQPGQVGPTKYIDLTNWAHYTYEESAAGTHAVTIVGWDDDYSASNFLAGHQPPADGAWIVKNSWGWKDGAFPNRNATGWGIDGNGYFYLSYYDMSLQNPESFNYDTTNYGQDAEYHLIDQYDFMPANSVTSLLLPDETLMANVFEASEDQNVRSLSCETGNPGTTVTYEAYVLNEGYANPEDGTLVASVTETYTFGGYHRVQLGEGFVVREGQHYSVVVTQKLDSGYEVMTDRSLNQAGMNFINDTTPGQNYSNYAVGIINPGESFLYEDGAWSDWAESVEVFRQASTVLPYGPIYDYDNFAIKAYADPVALPQYVTVPDLTNMTEGEAQSTLEQLGLLGQAGTSEYSDAVEANRVLRQDTPSGTVVEEGYLVTYTLSLGKEPTPDEPTYELTSLAKVGDETMPLGGFLIRLLW